MIRTKRLDIIGASEKDIYDIISIEKDKENKDYIWLGTYADHLWEINDPNHLLFIIKERDTDKTVGFSLIGLDFKSNKFEIRRIAITKKGIGYGKETMKALIQYAFEEMDTNRLWLDVYPDNEIGIKLYESLDLHRDGLLRQNYKSERGYLDQIVYSLLREEYRDWKSKHSGE